VFFQRNATDQGKAWVCVRHAVRPGKVSWAYEKGQITGGRNSYGEQLKERPKPRVTKSRLGEVRQKRKKTKKNLSGR